MRSMLAVASLAALVACCFAAAAPHVLRFEIESDKGRVGTFKFTNCLPPGQEMAVVHSLTISPDPLNLPGNLHVSFNATVKNTVKTPLKADVYLAKKMGSNFVKIPCFGSFGSCSYDDVCALLSEIGQCPNPFVSAGVPCKCPFDTGSYALPRTSFYVNSPHVPSGDYHARVNLKMKGMAVGCYDVFASVS